jgi:hypothetical protein
VRALIETLLDKPLLPEELRAPLERFAAHDWMDGFWCKITGGWRFRHSAIAPAELGGMALQQALYAYESALQVHNKAGPVGRIVEAKVSKISRAARELRNALCSTGNLIPSHWGELWMGRPDVTFADLIAAVEATVTLGDLLKAEISNAEDALKLPTPPRKRAGATSAQVFFSQAMMSFFRRLCAQPRYDLVAILESVVFDLQNPVTADTVRKRQRSAEH